MYADSRMTMENERMSMDGHALVSAWESTCLYSHIRALYMIVAEPMCVPKIFKSNQRVEARNCCESGMSAYHSGGRYGELSCSFWKRRKAKTENVSVSRADPGTP